MKIKKPTLWTKIKNFLWETFVWIYAITLIVLMLGWIFTVFVVIWATSIVAFQVLLTLTFVIWLMAAFGKEIIK